jgi:hypothetical protein
MIKLIIALQPQLSLFIGILGLLAALFFIFLFKSILDRKLRRHSDDSELIEDVFTPISYEYLCHLYNEHPESHERLSSLFRIKEKINEQSKKKLVVYSLFWKPQIFVNEGTIYEIKRWKNKTCSFFEKYVQPIICSIKYFQNNEQDTAIRIYLAYDLKFLIPQLSSPNVEIFLMELSSSGHSPGAMWRFLSLSEAGSKYISIRDSDDEVSQSVEAKINQWFHDHNTSGFYRLGSYKLKESFKEALYSPIQAGRFGAKNLTGIDIEKAIKGFILHRELYPFEKRHPRDIAYPEHPQGWGNMMPSYGFDERFLKHVIYYKAVDGCQLTTLCMKKAKIKVYLNLLKNDPRYLRVKDYLYVVGRNKKAIYY